MAEQSDWVGAVELLTAVIAGDARRIDELRVLPQTEIRRAARELGGDLYVGRPAVLNLLQAWQSGVVTDRQVHGWAVFLFVGAFPEEQPSGDWHAHFTHETQPLDIEYSEDDPVNEVVFRLKDLGDEIDGVITLAERDQMIATLRRDLP